MEKKMRTSLIASFVFLLVSSLFAFESEAAFGRKSAEKQRTDVLEMREETLTRLYKEKPSAEDMISSAVGYAVFSNRGVNVLLVSTASGKGIAHDNSSDKDVYMNMLSAGPGD